MAGGRKCDNGSKRSERYEEEALSQGMGAAPRNWKRQGTNSSLEPPEGMSPASTLIFASSDSF